MSEHDDELTPPQDVDGDADEIQPFQRVDSDPDNDIQPFVRVDRSDEPDNDIQPFVRIESDEPDVEDERDFEELTLAEAVGLLWRAPISTARAIWAVAQTPSFQPRYQAGAPSVFAPPAYTPPASVRVASSTQVPAPEPILAVDQTPLEFPQSGYWVFIQLVIRMAAVGLAVWGGIVMFASPIRSEQTGLDLGAPYLLAGFFLWLLSELLPAIFSRRPRAAHVEQAKRHEATLVINSTRALTGVAALITSAMAFLYNGGNMFTLAGVIAWVASLILWVWTLAPEGWNPLVGLQAAGRWMQRTRIEFSWTLVILLLIMGLGAYFRLTNLDSVPPEMTSDHVEKLLDVNRVLHGNFNVFFANNGGREAIQFYTLALMSFIPGLQLNFHLLKLLTVIEGMISLPILWWMGKEVIGKDEPRLGNAVGLTIAALVAVSYWDEMLSRLGLRIILTTLFTALVIIFLARALRYNRRSDFLWCGITLGFGVYAYQAMRMMPVAIAFAVAIAFIFWLRTWRDRRHMFMNMVALVLVAFAVFVPLFRYTVDYSEDFWRRTSGRLFGDAVMETTDANGNLIERAPTIQEELAAFEKNVPVLLDNFRNALLMYNWKGDVAWINNAPNEPAFDVVTGGLLIIGIGAWLARMIKRRDPFDWALIPLIIIMMLPSALSIAYPIENPSATRMSGTLPGVYLLAAFPLALIALALPRLIGRRIGALIAFVGVTGLVLASLNANYKTYFQDYLAGYVANSLPYSVGGDVLRQFAAQNGYGNAFILAYPYWWDHRALAIDGGDIDWANTITSLDDVPKYLEQATERPDDGLRLDVTKDMLIFYSPADTQAQQWLQQNFPTGTWQNIQTYQPGHSFNLYRVPALGVSGFAQFLQQYDLQLPVG